MAIYVHHGDLPDGLDLGTCVAIDSETMGLNPHRDRLCLVQLSDGKGDAHLVKFRRGEYTAPNLKALLENPDVLKVFHYARFDVAVMKKHLKVDTNPIYCTKIASKLVRTYTDRHGLKDLCRELGGVTLDKQQQSSDWGADEITVAQQSYAASDVLYLHKIKDKLDMMLAREERTHLAEAAFRFLPARCEMDLAGYGETDIFSH